MQKRGSAGQRFSPVVVLIALIFSVVQVTGVAAHTACDDFLVLNPENE